MTFMLSKRSDIEEFRALANLREAVRRINQGENIIRLEAGQPCFGVPEPVLEYARQSITNDPRQGYTEAIGTMELRAKIADYYKTNYDYDLNPERVAVTTASSTGFVLAFLSTFDAGDKVAIVTPTYPAYKNILRSLNIEVVEIESSAETNYQPTIELLESSPEKFSGLIINSPSNPTGSMIDDEELKRITGWCDDNGVRLVSDEAYHRITYETTAQTILPYSKNGIVLNTFSKYFAMTGWRLGWMVLPENVTARVQMLAENLCVSPPTISQSVACKSFDHMDVLDDYVMHYKKNRDIMRKGLPDAGISNLSAAQGAFYFYADVSHLTNDSEEFCRRMLDETGVAITSGLDFDSKRGSSTVRICYAGTPQDMEEACRRIKKWLA